MACLSRTLFLQVLIHCPHLKAGDLTPPLKKNQDFWLILKNQNFC